jgi:hypothetical protein
MVWLHTIFFHNMSVHFNGLAPVRNECVYALLVPWQFLDEFQISLGLAAVPDETGIM